MTHAETAADFGSQIKQIIRNRSVDPTTSEGREYAFYLEAATRGVINLVVEGNCDRLTARSVAGRLSVAKNGQELDKLARHEMDSRYEAGLRDASSLRDAYLAGTLS